MKNLYFFLFAFAMSLASMAQTTLYSENFTGQNGKGAVNGAFGGTDIDVTGVNWSIDVSSASFDGVAFFGTEDYFYVTAEAFSAKDTDGDAYWYSPSVNISGYTNVSFSLGLSSSGSCEGNDNFRTQYRLNGTGAWTNASTNGNISNDFNGTVSQTGLAGSSIQIRVVTSTNQDNDIYTFDNITVIGTVPPCTSTPNNVSNLTATPLNQQVALNWAHSLCYDEYLVVARANTAVTAIPTGNGSAYTANAAFGSGTQIATNEFVVYKGTGTTSTTTSLTNGTTYHFRVFSRKGSNWSSGVVVNATPNVAYCASNSLLDAFGYISRVRLNTIDNSSGASTYTNYTSISTNLIKGTQYNMIINKSGSSSLYYHTVWIDYNKDGDFLDAGEQVFAQNSTGNQVSGNFTVPTTITNGATRMRVSMKYDAASTPCEVNFAAGEVEDYTVDITGGITYVFNNGWTPSNPNGVATAGDNINVQQGNAVISANTNAGNITISPLGAMTVNSGVTLSAANGVTLQSNATQYSSLILNGSISGTINYNRHINGQPGVGVGTGANDLISAPVTGQAFSAFAAANPNLRANPNNNNQKLFGPFNKTTGTYQIWDVTVNGAETLNPGVGYRAASTDNGGFIFTGTVNTGNVSHNIVNSGPQFASYNLIGNPYPAYINVREFLEYDVDAGAETVRNIDLMVTNNAAIYGYDGDASGNGGDGWVVYNLNTPTTVNMAPGQGFLVTADAADVAAYDMTFTPSMRRIGNTDDFIPGRLANENNAHLKLNATIGTSNHKTDFYFNDNSTSGLDFGYDAAVFGSNASSKAIYSHLVEGNSGKDMAIQSLNHEVLGTDIVIPLGINVPQGQQVTVSIAESNLPSNIEVYLEDSVAGTFTLLNNADYIFTPNTNLTDTGRFYLRFADATLSNPDMSLNSLEIYATNSTKSLFVKGRLEPNAVVNLFDIQGRLVLTSELDSSSHSNKIDLNSLNTGVYVVQVNSGSQQKNQKIVLK